MSRVTIKELTQKIEALSATVEELSAKLATQLPAPKPTTTPLNSTALNWWKSLSNEERQELIGTLTTRYASATDINNFFHSNNS